MFTECSVDYNRGWCFMFVYLLLAGGILCGTAAFAGGHAYLLAGLVFALWLAAVSGRYAWRTIGRAGNNR
jgi:hypothetical protein